MEPKVNNLLLPQPLTSLQSEPKVPSDYPNRQDPDGAAFKPRPTAAQLRRSVDNAAPQPRPAKSVPLAEVLNSNSPKARPAARLAASQDDDPKKRRKLDDEQRRTLPKPSTRSKRRQGRLLPPVLAPLHNPPAQTRIFPSVNPDGLMPSISGISSPLHDPGQVADHVPASGDLQNKDRDGESDPSQPPRKGSRRMWTEAETQCLIDGVARFGIGSWKKILNHPEYNFQRGRNAIDLKDRFRTCFPAVYSDSAQQQQDETPAEGTLPDRRVKSAPTTTVELTKMGATEPVTFPKLDRRRRKHFTQDEDERLLRGFIKYGSQWKAIHMDPELGLQHRTRTDLRDRFRNRYPQRFTEAGFQHKAKQQAQQQQPPQPQPAAPPARDRAGATAAVAAAPAANPWSMDELVSNLAANPGATLEPAPSGPSEGSSHAMRLLAASGFDPFAAFDDFPAGGAGAADDLGGGGGVQLSRTIIDWADQNTTRQLGGGVQVLESMPVSIVTVPGEMPGGAMEFPAQAVQFGGPSTAPLSQILNARGGFGAHFQ